MAIQFARMEFVSRGDGGNVCLKAAYNKREKIQDERNGGSYSFAQRGGNAHHEIMLPLGASERFLDSSALWNHVEFFETRKNSRLAKEVVLALPDNREIGLEDRIELTRRFVKENFTDKGLAVQVDIHEPHHVEDKNWHAHLLITTRRFRKDGESFETKKARDLDGVIRKGLVLEIDRWGELWRDVQNSYFKEKGLDLRVDAIGAISQEHLGPVRMRQHMSEVVAKGELLKAANTQASLDPQEILKTITKTLSVFTNRHIDSYLSKHVREDLRVEVREQILSHPELVRLHDKGTGEIAEFYTTKAVRNEEEQVLRIADRVVDNRVVDGENRVAENCTFSEEQKRAFFYCLESGHGIRVVQGRAGTGKSYLMQGVREAYEKSGVPVVGLAPTHTVVRDMVASGFEEAKTIHEFLFRYKNDRISVEGGSVIMVDEASMIGTTALGELLKVAQVHQSKVILVGDDRQLSSVERGGLFKVLAEKLGSVELKEVRRQEVDWQRRVSEALSQGKVADAIGLLEEKGSLHWHHDKASSLSALVEDYSRSYLVDRSKTRLILAHRNVEVDVLNRAIQRVRQAIGEVSTTEYVCSTVRGEAFFSVGDLVQFIRTDKHMGLINGEFGILVEASKECFKIQKDNGGWVSFDPSQYDGLRLGYASTIYKGQGKTVEEAYVLHSPLLTENLSYVALTRQVKAVHLYVSQDEAKDQEALVNQLSRSDTRVVSVEFLTAQQLEKEKKVQESFVHKMAYGVGDTVRGVVQRFTDHFPNSSFYQVPKVSEVKDTEVREQNARDRWNKEKGPLDPEVREETRSLRPESNSNSSRTVSFDSKIFRETYDTNLIEEGLKRDIKGFAISLLGNPDLRLSTRTELCFRKDGKVFVNIQSGLWKDFVNDTGGNVFDLIQRERGGTFKESLAYAAQYLGQGPTRTPPAAKLIIEKSITESMSKEASAEVRQKVMAVYEKTKLISLTLGERYLREHRGIRGNIPQDVRFAPKMYNSEVKQHLPALVSFVRDTQGNLTGYQAIYLDQDTGAKASLDIAKRTHGTLSKSFVEIQKGEGRVYLSEGIETALSLKEAGVQGTILASLGIHNLKNYAGDIKNITLCADNDGPTAHTNRVVEKTKTHLEEKGYNIEIVRPTEIGKDFNDVLVQEGKGRVASYFKNSEPAPIKAAEVGAETKKKDFSSETLSSEKDASETQRSLEFPHLINRYTTLVTEAYKRNLGKEWSSYKSVIKEITLRSAREAIIVGVPSVEKETKILFARAQYELRRTDELREKFISSDPEFVDKWMGQHFKIDSIVSIEGRLFKELRQQQEKVEAKDIKVLQKEALKEYKENGTKVEIYAKEAKNLHNLSPEVALMFAQQRLLFEERYGCTPNHSQLESIKKSSEYAVEKYNDYKTQNTEKLTLKLEVVSDVALQYADHVAKYKALGESREILNAMLTSSDQNLPSLTFMKQIERTISAEFKQSKDHYEVRHQEQQKVQEKQKEDQAKNNQKSGPDMSL